MISFTRLSVILTLALFSTNTFSQTQANGYFVEAGGLLVIEAESISTFPDSWKNAASSTAPDLNLSSGSATGGDYLTWEGAQSTGTTGVSTLIYPIQINTPGVYRFRWRTQVGNGTNTTEHNDTWVKIQSDAFWGEQGSTKIVCPKGMNAAENDCNGGVPAGAGSNGWFKVYSSSANSWNWTTRTSDSDAHDIYVRFDSAGIYDLMLSARSSFHIVDRMVLSHDDYTGNPESISLPESQFVSDDASGGDKLTVDSSGQWFERQNSKTPVFMAGVGGPEGFLFETDTRKQQIVDRLIAQDVNALYFHSIRSFEGDGYSFEDPFVTHEDVSSEIDGNVLDNWRGYMDQLDANGIISWFHIIDDTARPWGCSVPLSSDAKRYISTIVNRFKDMDNLVWLAGEEFHMGSCTGAEDRALMRAIATEIRQHDPVHPIGVHHNNGDSMEFDEPADGPIINVFAQQLCGSQAHRSPDGMHDAAERGDWVYVMSECHPWHLNLLHDNDRRMIRLSNWASAMAGGYVLLYNAFECQHQGKLCSLNSSESPISGNDPHDPSDAILADLRRLREFMEASRFSELEPADQRATADTQWVMGSDAAGAWIAYSNDTPNSLGVTGLGNIEVQLRWFNPSTGAEVIQNTHTGNHPFAVPNSLGEDVALFIQRTGDGPVDPGGDDIALALIDAGTNNTVQVQLNQGIISVADLGISNWSISATEVPAGTNSIVFTLSGQQSVNQTESIAPYALFGDNNGNYNGNPVQPGAYTLNVKAYGGAGGNGTLLESLTISFTMILESNSAMQIFESGFEAP